MSAATEAAPAPSSGRRDRQLLQVRRTRAPIGTEARAGLTTFMVMVYIIFLNPGILMAGLRDRRSELHGRRAGRRHGPRSPGS